MIVKNEDRFVWYAIMSVLPYVEHFLVCDTGSTDRTWEILKNLEQGNSKLQLEQRSIMNPQEITQLRADQLSKTKTPWFLLVDGDEIWPRQQLTKLLANTQQGSVSTNTVAIVNHTRNCVGDVWHYLPRSFGRYRFHTTAGHYNIRLMRTLPYTVLGGYPDEAYWLDGLMVNSQADRLFLSPAWYLHATHLRRTSALQAQTFGRHHHTYARGLPLKESELPEIFFASCGSDKDILTPRGKGFVGIAYFMDGVRGLRSLLNPLTHV